MPSAPPLPAGPLNASPVLRGEEGREGRAASVLCDLGPYFFNGCQFLKADFVLPYLCFYPQNCRDASCILCSQVVLVP